MTKQKENKFTFECTDCGFVGEIYEFAYIGPKDRELCNQQRFIKRYGIPFIKTIAVCNECEEKRKGKNEKTN